MSNNDLLNPDDLEKQIAQTNARFKNRLFQLIEEGIVEYGDIYVKALARRVRQWIESKSA